MATQLGPVVTTGIHIVDILGRPIRAIPPGQGVELIEEIRMTVAGTAAGTAVDLAKLGATVETVGVVGDDELGRWMRAKMQGAGIDVGRLVTDPELPTSATLLPIRPNGERPALHVPGANVRLGPEHFEGAEIEEAEVFHIGGSCLLPRLDGEPAAELLRRARSAGTITTLDLIALPDADREAIFAPCYPHLDYFLPNDEDATWLSGQTTVADAARWFGDQGVGAAVISLGADGAGALVDGEFVTVPAYRVDVADTTGCGDAFSAGLIVGLLEGRDLLEAIDVGVACGSMVATGLGSDAGIIDRESVERFRTATVRRTAG